MLLSNMAMSLGLVIGSIAGGLIESSMGLTAVFRGAAMLGLIGVVMFNVFMMKSGWFSKESLTVSHGDPDGSATKK